MSLPRYPTYKDSGVAWLGEVPAHWKLLRLKFVCDIQTGGKDTEDAVDGGMHPFFVRSQNIERINSFAFDCEAVLTAGDGAGVGKVFHHYNGPFDFHQRVYMLNGFRGVSGRFIFHYLRENFYKVALEGGAKSTVDSLRRPMLTNFMVAVPPAPEQQDIVAFVDGETAKIDELVTAQRRLVGLLQEKRQALIASTVTRGLSPTAPVRETGIDWLGPVPAHWRLERGRFLFRKVDLLPHADDGVVTAFRDGQVVLREHRRSEGFTVAVLEAGYQRVRVGDLVVHGMDAFAGAIGVSESTGKCTPEYSVLTPAQPGIDNRYFAMVLRLMARRNYIYVLCPSVRERAPRFRFESLKDVLLPVPPIGEQHAIMDSIASTAGKHEALAVHAERTIDLLQERRAALVSAAVTGQIDVRPTSARRSA